MRLQSIPLWGWLCLLLSAGTAQAQVPANTFAASTNHSASIKPDGSLWTWGLNLQGQLGNGTTTGSANPVRVTLADAPNTAWAQVATGTSHTLGLTTDGRLYAWGCNAEGQLGDGTTTAHSRPMAVKLPTSAAHTTWKQIAAGTSHSLALTADGRLYAWGYNNSGQLGNGYSNNRSTPVEIDLPASAASTSWAQVAAGNHHTLALTADGRLYAWGNNAHGQLGDGSNVPSLRPVAVGYTKKLAKLRWATVAAGRLHNLAVTTDGRLYGWGSNRFGELATNQVVRHSLPAPVALPARLAQVAWKQVAAGDAHSLALSTDGRLVAWGNNCTGQLGGNSATLQLYPVPVAAPDATPSAAWTQVAGGGFHTLAYASDGQLYGWGANAAGQLGDGTTTTRARPVSHDPALTSQAPATDLSSSGGGSSGALDSAPWGLNDNRLLSELVPAPSFMLLPQPQDGLPPQ